MATPKTLTPAERAEAKAAKTRKHRVAFYTARIRNSRNGREQLGHACDYAKAVADGLDDAGRRELAQAITRLANERNSS